MKLDASFHHQSNLSKWVLIADDEAVIRRVARDYLQRCGYNVLLAANGLEALKLLEEHGSNVSVAILDLMMPYMDGHSLLLEIRRLYPDVKCIASSGLFAADDQLMIDELTGQGFSGILAKPFSCEELRKMVEHQFSPVANGVIYHSR